MPNRKSHTAETKKKISETKKAQSIVTKTSFKKGCIPWNKGKKCQYMTERNLVQNPCKSKDEHWNWKGGISKIEKRVRRMPEYINWRTNIFERDKYVCQQCQITNVYMTVHHIKSFISIIRESKIDSLDSARLCSELWNEDNGITLCEDCHSKTDNYKKRFSE